MNQKYKEIYYKELEYADKMNQKISISITMFSILGGAGLFLFREFAKQTKDKLFIWDWHSNIFVFLLCTMLCLFILCFIFFWLSYRNNYIYLSVEQISNYENEINKLDIGDKDQVVEQMMNRIYVDFGKYNQLQNNKKTKKHNILGIFTIILFVVTFVAYILYVLFWY